MEHYTRCKNQLGSQEYDLFFGLDVDKASIAVSVRDMQVLIKSLKLPYNSRDLLAFFSKHYPGKRIIFAYEAGPTASDCTIRSAARAIIAWW